MIGIDVMSAAEFRILLKSTGISQRALSHKLGVAVSTVNRWAMGTVPVPQYAVAYLELARINGRSILVTSMEASGMPS